jgi:hypothetical protein
MLIMWSSHVFFWMQTVARDLVVDNVWLVNNYLVSRQCVVSY